MEDELTSSAEARLGATIAGSYTLVRLIGVGGGGAVYEAEAANGSRVAVKVLHRTISRLPGIRERFHREALIARRIDHPGIVKVFDDGVSADGDLYLAMDLLDGESIEERAQRNGGTIPMNEVISVTAAALDVVDAAHRAGVIHRDLKPDNLFLTTAPSLKVLDFGIAKLDAKDLMVKRTRTGVIMGTPAYMAPEQAKASWGTVDRRTDVWAMGAVMFTLLSGRPVHQGEDLAEVLASAAMRPAPSLGRVMSAPIPLVRVVDRALSFDQKDRFQDAAEMRQALVTCVAELRALSTGSIAPPPVAPARVQVAMLEEREERSATADPEGGPFAIAHLEGEGKAALAAFFDLLGRTLLSITQYGMGHPETEKRLGAAIQHAVTETRRLAAPLSFNVTPYSFTADAAPLWEPEFPYDRVPYQLFADGVRMVTLSPGLEPEELARFVRLILKDRLRDLAPEDDFVTLLWEADLEHVTHQAVDSFGDGDLARRSRFERDVKTIQSEGTQAGIGDLARSFAARGTSGRSAADYSTTINKLVTGQTSLDAASVVQAEAMLTGAFASSTRPRGAGGTLDLSAEMRKVLESRLGADVENAEPRFSKAVALAWMEARASGATTALTDKVRIAIDTLAYGRADLALAQAASLVAAIEGPKGELASGILSASSLRRAIAFLRTNPGAVEPATCHTLLSVLDGTHFDVILEGFFALGEGPHRGALFRYLARKELGNASRLGALFPTASEEIGVAIVRLLTQLGSDEAKAALAQAAASPFGVVRIEALGHLEGTSSERLRLELKALLEDGAAAVRMVALQTVEKHAVRVAGPSLVLRIRSPKFDALPFDEKRQALRTLAMLAPRRAEEVAIELVGNAGLLPSEAREQTRTLAAELLGQIGGSDDAVNALTAAAAARFRSSEGLRNAAEGARAKVSARPPPMQSVPPPMQSQMPPQISQPSYPPPARQLSQPSYPPPPQPSYPPPKGKP